MHAGYFRFDSLGALVGQEQFANRSLKLSLKDPLGSNTRRMTYGRNWAEAALCLSYKRKSLLYAADQTSFSP
jgi:hypothetical protein